MTKTQTQHVRWAIRKDVPSIIEIENLCFDRPWSEEDFIRCLRQRNCIGMVLDVDDAVLGFMVYELHKNKLHILNLAVHPDHQCMGYGRTMIDKLKSKLYFQRRNRIMLEVRESNVGAQLFFRSQGFRAISVLRDFYEDTTEDAYLMQYRVEQ